MLLRWRRSLPTEKAWSPAPVMIATRTAGRTAIVSSDLGQSGAHLGRDGVVGVWPVQRDRWRSRRRRCSRRAREARARRRRTAAGRSRVPSSDRCVSSRVPRWRPPQVSSSASQRSARRPGAKQYSPPRVTTNGGRSCSRRRIGRCGIVKLAGAVGRPDERVRLLRGADEDPVVQPLGLDELELALQVRAGEDEDDARGPRRRPRARRQAASARSSSPAGSCGGGAR